MFKRVTTIGLIFIVLLLSCEKFDFEQAAQLPVTGIDPINMTKKNSIITYLKNISENKKTIAGQNVDYGNPSYTAVTGLSPSPGVMGIDLGWEDYNDDFSSLIAEIEKHWSKGGLITISMHPPNPSNRKDAKNKNTFDYSSLYDPKTDIGERWNVILNNTGNLFQELKNRNIIVLWRPFHEMNGGWFWWGNDKKWPTQNEFLGIWKGMYEYYQSRNLDNLLWVYSPNYRYNNEVKEMLYYYPGDEWVDVVGMDYYADDLSQINVNNSLNEIISIGKPYALCEIGPKYIVDGTFDNTVYLGLTNLGVSYFLAWHSWTKDKWAIIDNKNAIEMLNDSSIISLENININY